MKFDSNSAWNEAHRAVSANREVVLAIAGVFFLLPQLAFAMFFSAPQLPKETMSEQQMLSTVGQYYSSILPIMLVVALCQAVGTLTLLCLLNRAKHLTVGEAIREGLRGVLPYLGAQLITGFLFGAIAVLMASIVGIVGGKAGATVGLVLAAFVIVPLGIRLALAGPVIAIERTLNPFHALSRSWRLTQGNTVRVLGFFALLFVAALVLTLAANLLTFPFTFLGSTEVTAFAGAVIGGLLTALMALYFVAVTGQVYRQLAGATPQGVAHTFE